MKKREWTDTELEFLESNYLIMSDEEMSESLNRTVGEVRKTRYKYDFKKQRQTFNKYPIMDGKKWCWYCNDYHDLSDFNKNKSKPTGYTDECRVAHKKMTILRKKKKEKNVYKNKVKKCECCEEILPIDMFIHNVSTKDGFTNKCKICINASTENKKFKIKGDIKND